LLALASMAAVVARDLATRGLSREVPSFSVAIYSAAGVTLFSICAIPFEGGWPAFGLSEVLLIVIAALALVAGYLCAVAAMRVGEVGAVAPFRYSALVFAVMLGWLVFGQLPDGPTWLGAGIVVAASAFTLYRQRRLAARAQAPIPQGRSRSGAC
ncbi:DMT family transporter, partial [Thioclava sp. BHET1]